jgi:hypothetical protein
VIIKIYHVIDDLMENPQNNQTLAHLTLQDCHDASRGKVVPVLD